MTNSIPLHDIVKDVEEGLDLLKALNSAINATWAHRQDLVAVHDRHRAPRPLDIYVQLPQTNCGQCGDATCMAFAVGLLKQKHGLDDCPLLRLDSTYADRRLILDAML